jgi:hypothetical protein
MKRALVLSLICLALLLRNAGANSLFPEIPEWKIQEDTRVYNNNDLWELIDGAADIFLSYGFIDLHIAEYINNDQMIRVELYRHSSTDNAYGIYTAERMPDYPQVKIGSQGYTSQGVLNFLAGNYYVKIMSAGQKEADEATIAQLASKVDKILAQPPGLPEVLHLFPEEGKEDLSDAYIAQNFLGYSFFSSAFTARYKNDGEFQLFIIRAGPEETRHMLDEYMKMLKENKFYKKDNLWIMNDPFNGTIFLELKGNYLVGVINTENEPKAADYIARVIQKLP